MRAKPLSESQPFHAASFSSKLPLAIALEFGQSQQRLEFTRPISEAGFVPGYATRLQLAFPARLGIKDDSMRKSQRRVLLLTDFYDYRAIRGIEKYAQEHNWNLLPDVTQERRIPGAGPEMASWRG